MGLLVDGVWTDQATDSRLTGGHFLRADAAFRRHVSADPGAEFPAEAGRYHLYVALACPWANRTLIYRKLKRLDDVISVSIVDPLMLENGWTFTGAPGTTRDTVNGCDYMYQVYAKAKPDYTGRASVPVLWDKKRQTIVNNESSEIIRMLNSAFDRFGDASLDFYPPALRPEIDRLNAQIYATVNNGVYRAGFASTQSAYEEAYSALFATLGELEARLTRQRYLTGDRITEADWRLFTTLIRFDAVYYSHFKCNKRRIADYPALSAYTRELYQVPGVAETVDIDQIKRHYYGSHRRINPTGIVPLGPDLDFTAPHGRDRLPGVPLRKAG
ncbi:MAG TPA: glutathione S-transferase family protein [Candidatus Cybelea sp.]|nr:glutathione S-transferase family protein [Candidatus Cybelea sp.]